MKAPPETNAGYGGSRVPRPHKVLVIEDHDDLSAIYEFQLQRLGDFEIVSVTDGIAALETLEESFDLVLTDWQLPHLAGRELLEELYAKYPGLDVVVVSGFDPPADVDAMPCTDYLVKPVSREEWAALVASLDPPEAVA